MRAQIVLLIVAVVLLVSTGTSAQQQQQPIRVNPAPVITPTQPATPTTPARPAPLQQKILVAPVAPVEPAAQPLNADQIRAVAIQSAPPANATREQQASLQRVAERLRHKDRAQAQTDWAFLVERAARSDDKHKKWIELESWSNYVLHHAYVAPNDDFSRAADKVRFYEEQNTAVTAQRADLGRAKQNLGATTTRTITVQRLALPENFEPQRDGVEELGTREISSKDLDKEIKEVEEQQRRIREDREMANIDLQNKLQKQQQTLQTMSNISKMLHDTAMATIRKIGS